MGLQTSGPPPSAIDRRDFPTSSHVASSGKTEEEFGTAGSNPFQTAMSSKTKTSSRGKAGRSAIADVVAREYTIHLHKRVSPGPVGFSSG